MKAEDITIDEARELVSNQRLWPIVRDFLWDFAPSIHASWLNGLQASDFAHGSVASDLKGPKPSPRIKRFVLSSLGVEPCFHAFPREDGSRLLLLDAATLESVVKWLGALACADALRHVTDGATVRKLKSALHGVYPEVFGFTAYFNDLVSHGAAELRSEDIVAEVVANGYVLLFSAFSKLPASVVSRARFKLSKDLRVTESPREIDLPVVLKLLKLKFPEAYKLCCS